MMTFGSESRILPANHSLGDQYKSSGRTSKSPVRNSSKSPGKRTSGKRIQPLDMSLGDDDDNRNDPIENLNILRSVGEPVRQSNPRHVAFDDSNLEITYRACSKCSNRHFSGARRMPWSVSSEELQTATNNFNLDNAVMFYTDEYLFKGSLDGYPVYVSRRESYEMLDFLSEVDILATLRHPNIITLRAFCQEFHSQALVFNFVCSRSLSFHLSPKNINTVQWPKRTNLAIEMAKGLVYLHHDRSIIHGNINSLNVFLTHDFEPVIGDFSLSRKNAVGRHSMNLEDRSADKKARGYLAPEYRRRGESSEKQDTYAFGVILIELISGLAPFERKREIKFLDEWGRKMIQAFEADPLDLVAKMVDERLARPSELNSSFAQMIKVAKLCLQEEPRMRPSMAEVLENLRQCTV
ncbi:unnamed protein product [Calypogeia fissa]